jgi:hypothetical protein
MSWVIYLKFLSAGKFVLIECLTFNYIFVYFWNVIWLDYQFIIHACSEAIFREVYFSTNFHLVSGFLCEAFGQSFSWVQTRTNHSSGRLNDTSEHSHICRVLIWQWPFRRVSYASGRVPYGSVLSIIIHPLTTRIDSFFCTIDLFWGNFISLFWIIVKLYNSEFYLLCLPLSCWDIKGE